jgi:hypothetical protein
MWVVGRPPLYDFGDSEELLDSCLLRDDPHPLA